MHYDAQYREDVTLSDGTRARLRLVTPDDKARLVRGFELLSSESRYLRFFARKETLSTEELAYLTEMDQQSHFALGAVEVDELEREGEGMGVARFVRLPDRPDTAEAAVVVADRLSGRGLGRLLLQRLVGAAVERGVARFRFEVLAENAHMKGLLQGLAPGAELKLEEGGVIALEWPLPTLEPGEPTAEVPKDNPLYRLLRAAAEGLVVAQRWLLRGHPPASA